MTFRPSDLLELALVVVSSILGASLAVALPFVGVPIAAMSLGWLSYRRGFAWSIPVTLGAAVAGPMIVGALAGTAGIGGWRELAFTVPVLLAAGPGSAWALTRWPGLRTVVVLAATMFTAAVAYQTLAGLGEGRSFLALQRLEAAQAGAIMAALLRATGETDSAALARAAGQYARTSFLLWPSSFAYTYALAAALVVPLVSRMGRALGRAVKGLPPLAEIDVSLHVVWPAIAGLALVAAATFLRQPDGLMWAAGVNLLLLARAPLFVQGLGDFAALYRKASVGRIGRAFGFTFLTVSEVVIPSVSVVGLVDLFANLRKLPRSGTPPRTGLEGGRGRV